MKKEPNLSRRAIIYATVVFCGVMLTWLAWYGDKDSQLHMLIAEGCFYLLGFVILFYVLSANIDGAIQLLQFRFGGAGRRGDDDPRTPVPQRRQYRRRERDPEEDPPPP